MSIATIRIVIVTFTLVHFPSSFFFLSTALGLTSPFLVISKVRVRSRTFASVNKIFESQTGANWKRLSNSQIYQNAS